MLHSTTTATEWMTRLQGKSLKFLMKQRCFSVRGRNATSEYAAAVRALIEAKSDADEAVEEPVAKRRRKCTTE